MMLNVDLTFSKLIKLNKLYIRLFSSSILASLGIMLGLTPEISINLANPDTQIVVALNNHAYGQEFTTTEIENYAKAGYAVELLRRDVYQQIKNLINETPPDILCDRQSTIDNLKPEVKDIANRYCNQSQQIVQQHNLSINRFNELKRQYDRQDGFYQQVQKSLMQLQR